MVWKIHIQINSPKKHFLLVNHTSNKWVQGLREFGGIKIKRHKIPVILKTQTAGEFDSKAWSTNPLDFYFSERLWVIPGLVGGWLPDSCTATNSWTNPSLLLSLGAHKFFSCPTGWCTSLQKLPFSLADQSQEYSESSRYNLLSTRSGFTFYLQ